MIRPRVILTSLLAGGMLASFVPFTPAAEAATLPAGTHVTIHANPGCAGLTKVYTPASGHTLSAQALHIPGGQHAIWAYAAKRHVRWLSRLTCRSLRRRPVLRPAPSSVHASFSSTNWSGYQLIDPAANQVEGFWSVPAVTGNGQNDFSSAWVGLGGGFGSSPGELIQDGTESDVASSGATSYAFWIEDFPAQPAQFVTNLVPNAGDSVAAASSWVQGSNGTAFFTLCDYTQNTCVQGSEVTDPPGSSVEWIVERPEVGGAITPLARYVAVTFTNCFYADPNSQQLIALGDSNPSAITMVNNGHVLSSPGSINPDRASFSTFWQNFS
jgi:Peptidase A4 family